MARGGGPSQGGGEALLLSGPACGALRLSEEERLAAGAAAEAGSEAGSICRGSGEASAGWAAGMTGPLGLSASKAASTAWIARRVRRVSAMSAVTERHSTPPGTKAAPAITMVQPRSRGTSGQPVAIAPAPATISANPRNPKIHVIGELRKEGLASLRIRLQVK
jgi:hypothetical protein